MCLSPQVDIAAGVVITGFAVDALRHVRSRRTLPLALLPAVFAFHTFTSAFVWWGLDGPLSPAVGDAASNVFIAIAYVLLPVFVPLSILALEPGGWRRDLMLVMAGAGILSGALFAQGVLGGRASAQTCSLYIDYQVAGTPSIAGALYVIATVGPMLVSGQRPLLWWGLANAAAVAALIAWDRNGLPSLWCFWAACTSFFVTWYLRRLQRDRAAGLPWPWEGGAQSRGGSVPPEGAAVQR